MLKCARRHWFKSAWLLLLLITGSALCIGSKVSMGANPLYNLQRNYCVGKKNWEDANKWRNLYFTISLHLRSAALGKKGFTTLEHFQILSHYKQGFLFFCYKFEILEENLQEGAKTLKLGQEFTFLQDNHKQTSRTTIQWNRSQHICALKWPSQRPHLNSAENLWQVHVFRHPPSTLTEAMGRKFLPFDIQTW